MEEALVMEKRIINFKKQEFRDLLVEFVKLFSPETYIEIGVAHGYTFNIISSLVERAIAVDPNMHHIKHRKNVKLYKCKSNEFFKKYHSPIDFCFIDGDHSRKQAYIDFRNTFRLLKEHTGLIFMHDTYPINKKLLKSDKCSNAWQAVLSIKKYFVHAEVLTLPGPINGLTIIRKAKTYGWMDE